MNRKLEETLETCLADIREGRATLNECLSRYPDLADELVPLLRVSISLRGMSRPQPSERRVLAGRQRVLREFTARPPVAWWKRAFAAPALTFAVTATFLFLAVFGTGVFMAVSNGGPVANAYPNPGITQPQPESSPVVSQPTITVNGIGVKSEITGAYELASASDGTLWFVQADTAQVGSVDNDRSRKNWSITSNGGSAAGITVDSAGRVWVTDPTARAIVMLDPESKEVTSWNVPWGPGIGSLGRITTGADGFIWFIDRDGSRIYSLNSEDGTFTAYDVEGAEYLQWADGSLWFSGRPGQLGRITPGWMIDFVDAPGEPTAMVWDGESLWYAGGALVGRMDIGSGSVNVYPLDGATADRIATDGLGNIWFGSQGRTELGLLQAGNGQISMRSLDALTQGLYSLAVGREKVWVSDSDSRFIYSFSLSLPGEAGPQIDHFMASLSLAIP
ncbi:MAG: hypothetical protein HYZ23_05140 [Chloroflexi bacterium]|nr:hypothetical protein [Chloroflexota bacterium]